ncbi:MULTISPECIES: Gfo/Idh/MocA family protein [Anaerotruncus]|uniref:Gfo/Idh/MocA family protein n=2 Tax=Oscillospiraceae TaxID=216572 RepID=UPI000829F3F7|nr:MULTISPECIES: Gfo/Idh/MocA family oxidoreductase [Anaerotruncus]RGX54983.1 gfo/Idh/MocA family oxidoreductase [Anaerotruncus sp. AF02-27]
MQKSDGMNYAPVSQGRVEMACRPGEFPFGVIGLDHGHIYAICNGLLEAGATLNKVWDPDPEKVRAFLARYPQAQAAENEAQVLDDPDARLIASAIRPSRRCALGLRVMEHGKDYFVDKPGMLTKEELSAAREACARTGQKYVIYYGERIHVEGAVFAEELIRSGAVGKVRQVTILAPHRLNRPTRPDWFFEESENGGIITDLGSHQIEQFLTYCGAKTAAVLQSAVANYANRDKPHFCDFGEGVLLADNGATCFFRVDWFTPDGMGAWGDGRVFVMGEKGSIEIRKYIDVSVSHDGDHVIWVDAEGEHRAQVTGKTGFVFFGRLIRDCLDRTENAITQEHTFEAMRLAIETQEKALRIDTKG